MVDTPLHTTSSLISPWQEVTKPSCVSFIYHKTTRGAGILEVRFFHQFMQTENQMNGGVHFLYQNHTNEHDLTKELACKHMMVAYRAK